MAAVQETIDQVRQIDVDQYKYGFETEIEVDKAPKGLSEEVIRFISAKKEEPEWMLAWRLEAYQRWLTMEEPTWARVNYPKIDFNDLYYYAAPKPKPKPKPTTPAPVKPAPGVKPVPTVTKPVAPARPEAPAQPSPQQRGEQL